MLFSKIKIRIGLLIVGLILQAGAQNRPVKCGFLQPEYGLKRAGERRAAQQDSFLTADGHFTIFFDTTGYNAPDLRDNNLNNIPDLVEIAGSHAEKAWRLMIDTMGFHPPFTSDGRIVSNYPIFIRNLSTSLYGQTVFVGEDIPSVPGINYESFIELNSNYEFASHLSSIPFERDSMGMAVTISHEFFHAIQLGYNVRFGTHNESDDLWWIEASAVFFEEELTPQINDYFNYLDDYFSTADRSVYYQSGNRIYGEVLIPLMLKKKAGRQIIREIWEKSIDDPAIQLIASYLKNHDSSWEELLGDIGQWIMAAGYPNQFSDAYPDLEKWPEFNFYEPVPVSENNEISFRIADAYSVVLFHPLITEQNITKLFPDIGKTQKIFYASRDFGIHGVTSMPLLKNIAATASNPFKIGWAAGAINTQQDSARIILSFSSSDLNKPLLYPNPLKFENSDWVIIENGMPGDNFSLFDMSGVRVFSRNFQSSELLIDVNDLVSVLQPGVYIYMITGEVNNMGKLMVIR